MLKDKKEVVFTVASITIILAVGVKITTSSKDTIEIDSTPEDVVTTEQKELAKSGEIKIDTIGDCLAYDFIDECKRAIKASYAPIDKEEYDSIPKEFSGIMTDACINQLYDKGVELTGEDFNNTLKFNVVRYGFKQHQSDEKRRIYMNITVSNSSIHWDINIELLINDDIGKIDNIDVW